MLLRHGRSLWAYQGGSWLCGAAIDFHEVEVIEALGYLAQLVFILLVVQGRADGLDRLVPLGLALVRDQDPFSASDVDIII